MGAIQESTPEMRGWGVELRSESFWLHDPEPDSLDDGNMNPALHFKIAGDDLVISAADAAAIGACLDLVEAWLQRQETSPPEARESYDFAARAEGERIVLSGAPARFWTDGSVVAERGLTAVGAIELAYRHIPVLRAALAEIQQ